MKLVSKLPGVARPRTDVFSYLFDARRPYPKDRVMYREDKTNATLTLEELEHRSRQFAGVLVDRFNIQPLDVVGILLKDSVCRTWWFYSVCIVYLTVIEALLPGCIPWSARSWCNSPAYSDPKGACCQRCRCPDGAGRYQTARHRRRSARYGH